MITNRYLAIVFASIGALALVGCIHGDGLDETPVETSSLTSAVTTSLDPLGLGGAPVYFERRTSNACPDSEGGEMWYAKLDGIVAVKVTYGIRSKGSDTGQRDTFKLDPRFIRKRRMFCTGDGVNLDFEPFIVTMEAI